MLIPIKHLQVSSLSDKQYVYSVNLAIYLSVCVWVTQSCLSLQFRGRQPTRLLCPWNSPDKDTEVGCHSLLQGIFLGQGLNMGLLHCRQFLYHLSHQGSPNTKYQVYILIIYTEGTFSKLVQTSHSCLLSTWGYKSLV